MDGKEFQKIKVRSVEDIGRLALCIPNLIGDSGFVPVLSSNQLVVFREGSPMMSYEIEESSRGSSLKPSEIFLDVFHGTKHMVLLYDEPEEARSLEFRFFKIGLEKNEQCIYSFSSDDIETEESITNQMREYGIDVQRYEREGLLKFVKLKDPVSNPKGYVEGGQENIDLISSNITKTPVRVVAHQRYLFNTNEELEGQCEMENVVESNFETFPGSLLCNLYLGSSAVRDHGKWVRRIIQNHDNAIVLSSRIIV